MDAPPPALVIFYTIYSVVLLGLILPAALREHSWKRFFAGGFYVVLGISLPVMVYLLSLLMMPEWKGESHFGWLGCFGQGKLAFVPLILWGIVAFYVRQAFRPACPNRAWIALGLLAGAISGGVCTFIGCLLYIADDSLGWVRLFLLVPFYVTIWYGILARRALRAGEVGVKPRLYTIGSALVCWIATYIWCRQLYAELPDNPPSCFVVTAASRGHAPVVGPFAEVTRHGRVLRANRQLVTFWQLEACWSARSPATHRAFRRVYNRVGPAVARRVTTPLAADAVHLALKPAEWLARLYLAAPPRQ